ncbi:MAG: Phosphate transporter, periplasmic phosphate-binding protein PstS, partial [Gemmataceae bacterium]|nr:Phosphate transporter, periplasmic phosphate-binding protein PstS [Gemmataceae bacterium]
MPPVETADTFLDLLERSGLLRPDLIAPLRGYDPPGPEDKSLPQRLAAHLVRQRLLTAAQAAYLLRGRVRGFFITTKYKIMDRLGAGGMGTVFLCEHLILQRLVAVKVLTGAAGGADVPEGAVQRFYREARAVAALDHQNIVRVFDVDSAGGQPFMVMEYVDGTDLHRITTAQGGLKIPQAVDYVRQAATGLQHAHEAGLVHRDIKPGNILVDRAGAVKILDLGLARFHTDTQRNENLTARFDESAILGTADFISPEQIHRTSDVDIRSDIYSLGCTLYFLLAGRSVFDEGSATQKLIWHQSRAPTLVTDVRPSVPSGLATVVAKMMAKRPDERYQTPTEVAAALVPFAQAPVVPPPSELMPKAPASSYRLGLCRMPPPGSSLRLSKTGSGRVAAGPPVADATEPDSPLDGPTPFPQSHSPTQRVPDAPPAPPSTPLTPHPHPAEAPGSGRGPGGPP